MTGAPRVAFDLTPVISGSTGIARYATQIRSALASQTVDVRPFAVGRSSFPVPPGTRHVRIPARLLGAWWNALPWPYMEQLVGGADLVHATGLFLPSTRVPLVVTVHDLGALRHPDLHPPLQVQQQRALLAKLRQAAVILAVSGAASDDLVSFGIRHERVVVAPLGRTPLPAPDGASGAEASRAADTEASGASGADPSRQRFLLTVGETAARKGYGVLLEALARLDRGVRLVMAGPPGADEQRLQDLIVRLDLGDRVDRLGAVGDGQLARLYRDALALCFPSVTEGFGLPVLEAMAAGTPVLASDIPATRELAGPVALYVEDRTAEAWAQALDALIAGSLVRPETAEAGRQRAAQYTWERTAGATMQAYRLALGAANSGG